ncbi:protein ARV1-like [Oppia nitens]|uniref:protein ARV1-like n=1 Tax=Oppia nitens TaxID=1686743 RepID=UPI0023DA7C43|nr:protein ARV1-like [Oppia nitens]
MSEMFVLSSIGPYVCCNCGFGDNQSVFKIYGNRQNNGSVINPVLKKNTTHLKLTECLKCGQPVDEYVQLDNCILFLDAILQKQSFYRHILLNSVFDKKVPLKLAVVFGLCDAYRKWSSINETQHYKSYIELEFSFYLIFTKSITENLLFYSMLYLLFTLMCGSSKPKNLLSSFIICSYGKIFSLPAILWTQELKPIIDLLLEAFLLISLVQCCRVKANNMSKIKAIFIVALTLLLHQTFLYSFETYFLKLQS